MREERVRMFLIAFEYEVVESEVLRSQRNFKRKIKKIRKKKDDEK